MAGLTQLCRHKICISIYNRFMIKNQPYRSEVHIYFSLEQTLDVAFIAGKHLNLTIFI